MNIHHAVADGFHLSRFFLEVQKLIDLLDELYAGNAEHNGCNPMIEGDFLWANMIRWRNILQITVKKK